MLKGILTYDNINEIKYKCLSKAEQEEWKKNHPFIHQKPKCYSCGDTEGIVHGWYAEDKQGNKAYTCKFCLDAYTTGEEPFSDFSYETDLNFSSKRVLKNFRVKECECGDCDRSFITACRSDKYCSWKCAQTANNNPVD